MTTETKKKKKHDKTIAILHADAITEDFITRCERHLDGRHVTLWGQAFDVKDPKRRRVAAEWLASEIVSLMIERTEGNEP